MKLLPALCAGAVTVGLLVPVAPVSASPTAPPSPAARRLDSKVTVHPYFHQRKYGETLRISGQLRYFVGQDIYAARGAKVTLLRRPAGTSRWRAIDTDQTSQADKPTYAFKVVTRGNTTYRVRFGGNARLQPSKARAPVWVHRKVSSQMLRPKSGELRLVGHVKPGWRHKRVALQKRSCRACSWHIVRRQRTNAESRFNFGVGAPRSGSWFFRVQVPRTTRFAPSVSATYRTYS